MGAQLERGSKDENVCPVLGDWLCLGKTQGYPGSSAPRGGEAHSRHRRRRVGASTRSPRSPGTARWSWSWLERWTSGCWLFHRAWKRRLGLERGFWRRQLPALGHVSTTANTSSPATSSPSTTCKGELLPTA